MIWTNTDYATYLIEAAQKMLEHYGEEESRHVGGTTYPLGSALNEAREACDEWGEILWQNPDEAARSPRNCVQDLLNFITGEHARFDHAISRLEQEMRRLSRP